MFLTVNGIELNYNSFSGEGKPIVLLHGWGASSAAMAGVFRFLQNENRTVYALDFPGFGQSGIPPSEWGIHDYAKTVKMFLLQLKIDNPILIGHSFGGRIAILLGAEGIPEKIILTDAAGIKPKFSLKKKLKIVAYKLKKQFKKNVAGAGSSDYKALPEQMKPVFVRIVNTHLNRFAAKIHVPVLLIWGDEDVETPLYMAQKLNKLIPDSGLATLKGCGHFAYAENLDGFCTILKAFI